MEGLERRMESLRNRKIKGYVMQEKLLKRVDELINQGNAVLATKHSYDLMGDFVNEGLFAGFRTASLSFLHKLFTPNHIYCSDFNEGVIGSFPNRVETGINILNSVKKELEDGWVFELKDLVTAEIFTDFLEMAEYFLSEGYKDPAAVIIGGVLEEHLRQLCQKNSIPITITKGGKEVAVKANKLNQDLAKAGHYNKLDMKSVTAWLDLRNKAAHGNYNEYDKSQVEVMLQGVMDFVTRNPLK